MEIRIKEKNLSEYYIEKNSSENEWITIAIMTPKKNRYMDSISEYFGDDRTIEIISEVRSNMIYYNREWNCKNIALTLKENIEKRLKSYIIII